MEGLKQLLMDASIVYSRAKALQEKRYEDGELFNIFNVVGLRSEEVRLHSALIAELLNPQGSHGMGSAFLEDFLCHVIGVGKDYISSARGCIVERHIGVVTETTGGRIDIIIEDGNHALIIENKIYARDQHHQLLRYYTYASREFPRGFKIVYLNLDGREASTGSLGGEGEEVEHLTISYRSEVRQWLTRCARMAYDKPLVREIISQYITLIDQLTNNNMDRDSKNEIVELAIQNIEGTTAIMANHEEIGALLRKRYIFEPLSSFTLDGRLLRPIVLEENEGSPMILFKSPGWRHHIAIATDLSSNVWRRLYIGVSSCSFDESGWHDPDLEIGERLQTLSSTPNEWWPYGWEWLPYSDWEDSSSFIPIKSGEVYHWITDKVKCIVEEIESRQLPM